jgi:hypothetical protein
MSNDRVEAWLRERGQSPEPEPAWVAGRKPDFFCPGPTPIWVEVKTLEQSQHQQTQDRAWNDFRSRIQKIEGATGTVYAMTSQAYTQAHGKVAARLVKELTKATAPASREVNEVIVIPPDPLPNALVTIRYESTAGEVIQIGPKTVSGRYHFYPSYDPQDWAQEVVVVCGEDMSDKRQIYDVFIGDSDGPIAVNYCRSDSPIWCTLMSMGGRSATAARLRLVINDANDQLRSGQRCVPAPGVCVIYHESLDATSDQMFLAALFGDLTIPIELNPTRRGTPFLGNNGILSPTQNRGVSAVRYVTLGLGESIALNPYADFPIDADFFNAPVWVPDGEAMSLHDGRRD